MFRKNTSGRKVLDTFIKIGNNFFFDNLLIKSFAWNRLCSHKFTKDRRNQFKVLRSTKLTIFNNVSDKKICCPKLLDFNVCLNTWSCRPNYIYGLPIFHGPCKKNQVLEYTKSRSIVLLGTMSFYFRFVAPSPAVSYVSCNIIFASLILWSPLLY